ncbi:uncharacterized protein LOC108734142, partial [Agrilus planipennis]|uniref:Uncharacterized protein LOC108734142 n=1 Tax=Agrilus planipennis TaxID=224129 RepID=A0A7F5RF54_AGRPL
FLASFFKVCSRSDPNLNDCIKESVEQIRPHLEDGIPEFGIPRCEPLKIPEVSIDQGSGPVSLKSTFKNIEIHGPSKFGLKSVRIDLDKNKVKIKLWIPNLLLQGDYSMEGRILMMPIVGNGKCTGNYSNIEATIVSQAEKIRKDGQLHYNVTDFFVEFSIGSATVHLDNLFNGDKVLGEAMNLFINDNWKNVANEIKPVLEETIADIFKRFCNKIFHKYPINVLLLISNKLFQNMNQLNVSVVLLVCAFLLPIICRGDTKIDTRNLLYLENPPWLKVCKRSDPNLNSCINEMFKNMFPSLATGIPEVKIQRFEPLHLDRVSVSKGSGPIVLAGSLYNLTVFGPSNATPTYNEIDIKAGTLNSGIFLPLLDIKSLYNLKGKILVLPLVGEGICHLKLSEVDTKVVSKISFPKIAGREILKINQMKVTFTVGDMNVELKNLFNGNKVLGQTVNSFLNKNSAEVISELSESIGDSLAIIFTDLMNEVFSKIPTDLWLLE